MNSLISQITAIISMNVRSLPQRLWMSLAMVIASAVVVAVLLAFLAMSKGFDATLSATGSDSVALFMREGSAAEINSTILRDQVNLVLEAPGVMKDSAGTIASAELYVIANGIKKSSQTEANIPLRGIDQRGMDMRGNVQIVAGRMFTTGTNELIVGSSVLREFDGFNLGEEIRFGRNRWRVVGVFTANGNVFESELWADVKVIKNLYDRISYQTVRVQMATAADLDAMKAYIANEPRLNLEVQTEADYFAEQGKQLRYIAIFGRIISLVMALGALAGALNTMYTSVAERAKEIATLRAIGFSGLATFVGTLVEAMVLAAIGGTLGCVAAFIVFDGFSASTMGGSFTQVVFSLQLTMELFIQGGLLALAIGFISGFFPAWKAARLPVIVAFTTSGYI